MFLDAPLSSLPAELDEGCNCDAGGVVGNPADTKRDVINDVLALAAFLSLVHTLMTWKE